MTDIAFRRPDSGAFPSSARAASTRAAHSTCVQAAEESQYLEMEAAFRATGGIAGSGQMTALLQRHTEQPISALARWIVGHEVIGFEWRGHTLVPLFQFNPATMAPRPAVTEVVRELVPAMGEWDAALWFARANPWLGDAAPVNAIGLHPRAVFHAARAERYVARG